MKLSAASPVEARPFRLTPYFSLISLVGTLVATACLILAYREYTVRQLVEHESRANADITRAFANTVWNKYRPFIVASAGKSRSALLDDPAVAELRRDVLNTMRGMKVAKIKVYNLDGLTVFSTDAAQIGEDKSGNEGFRSARAGRVASQITYRDRFDAFEGALSQRNLIFSYVPVATTAGAAPEGVVEVYSDVTELLEQQSRAQWQVAGIVLASLAALYVFLFFVVRKADRLIVRQEQETQAAMVQAEKMSGLAQMVAGIAHEINTPLAYVRSTLELLREQVQALGALAKGSLGFTEALGRKERDNAALNRQYAELRQLSKDAVEGGLVDEFGKLLTDGAGSIDRISEIVRNLKNFSRLDRALVDEFDVREGLESTLLLARNVVGNKVRVVKHFDDVPKITCSPSQINQVLLNLITNAVQAIPDGREGVLTLRTEREDDKTVRIEVQDNGSGIPEDVLPRIFDPFFTTKEVGKGTGMGLSISYKIVRQHGGAILVDTENDVGTTFTVLLPIAPPAGLAPAPEELECAT